MFRQIIEEHNREYDQLTNECNIKCDNMIVAGNAAIQTFVQDYKRTLMEKLNVAFSNNEPNELKLINTLMAILNTIDIPILTDDDFE